MKNDMPEVNYFVCKIADKFPELFDLESQGYGRLHKLEELGKELADNSISKAEHQKIVSKCLKDVEEMEFTVKEQQDKHKAQLAELEKQLIDAMGWDMHLMPTERIEIIKQTFKDLL